mmetsp:Transcript_7087/g.10684  ORF Transcript_7087/g.10684 Transcript_7087/m.10684 type:complete len:542 (-) Transcript_7087:65-1690(-)
MCQITIGSKKLRWMRKLVERQYRVHLTLDSLPVLMRSKELNYAVRGFPVGFTAPPHYTGLKEDEYYLYNHLRFTITYREQADEFEGVRITGFDVHPVSIRHDLADSNADVLSETIASCGPDSLIRNDPASYLPLRTGPTGEPLTILYSYSVEWQESDVPWSDRWDVYLMGSPDDDVHVLSIINAIMVVLFLTASTATIMIRTLRNDIALYNELDDLEDAQEETGWKLVHGDVFRPPSTSPLLLSVATGTGAQIGASLILTLICAILKIINPMNKGATLTAIIFLYVLSGSVAGYISARLYKFCDAKAWKRNTIATAIALPGALMTVFLMLNIFLALVGAATSVSIFTIISVFLLWTCISTPLVFVGSYFGFRAERIQVPTKTNHIARFVPEQQWHSTFPWCSMLGGVLPFASVTVELFFIMSALWLHQYYYMMGFLLVVFVILGVTCVQISVVMTYVQLCGENHRWWWKSFFSCASAGFYLFLYSLWFLATKLELVGFLPIVVYFTYMLMISVAFGLFCGSIGLLSSFWFTRVIYGAVKVD